MDAMEEIRRLRARVAELEAQQPHSFREEFAIAWDEDAYAPAEIEPVTSFSTGRRLALRLGGGRVVRREVRTLSTEWRAV